MRWLKSNESKGLFISIVIHTTLLGAVVLHEKDPIKIADKETTVSIDLISYQPPKPIEESIPEPIIKPQPKEVPQLKDEPQHKPIVQKKPKEQPKPKPKEQPKPKPKDEPKPKQIEKQNTQQNIKEQQQAYTKTDFAIIRDMVLVNLKNPMIAQRMGWSGVAEIKLIVDASGKLINFSIIKSSGKKQLDEAALSAVQSITNKTLPKPKHTTTIILPISFKN